MMPREAVIEAIKNYALDLNYEITDIDIKELDDKKKGALHLKFVKEMEGLNNEV